MSDCTSLPREKNGSYISSKKMESKYNRMEKAKEEDCEREDEDYERENGSCEG